MVGLEKTLEEVKPRNEETRGDTAPLAEKPFYQGLRLIEDKTYAGYTSIRYWM